MMDKIISFLRDKGFEVKDLNGRIQATNYKLKLRFEIGYNNILKLYMAYIFKNFYIDENGVPQWESIDGINGSSQEDLLNKLKNYVTTAVSV